MANLIELIKTYHILNSWIDIEFNEPYDKNWTDEELLSHIIELYCCYQDLITLPNLPNCKKLSCYNNKLKSLPELPKCEELNCECNYLTSLPNLPSCKELFCSFNRLTSLPNLPNCKSLDARCNRLQIISYLPICSYLDIKNELLQFDDMNDFKKIGRFTKLYMELKYFRLWYKFVLRSKANRKKELHLELLYSPNLPFYKNTDEYKHFNSTQNYLDILPD